MNEFLFSLGWVFNICIFFIVIFWVKKFSQIKWKLFFGSKRDLYSVQHHELHSCFLTTFSFLIFNLVGVSTEQYLLSLEMSKMDKIMLFYPSMMIVQLALVLTLFCLHLVRGCTFSPTARMCTYMTIVYMLLLFMDLIARGYYGFHALGIIYTTGVWVCKLVAISVLATYPLKSLKKAATEKVV